MKSLPLSCLRRPLTTLMIFLGVSIFGLISVFFLKQELFPTIAFPQLTVVTRYSNAAPNEVENLITKPVEEAVGSAEGLRKITSISREGLSLVMIQFDWNRNMDFAALNVREKIDLMKSRLPRDSEEPLVIKYNPLARPLMRLSASSRTRDPVTFKRFADRTIKEELEKENGVAAVVISGGADEEILVEVDHGRLKALNLSILDVSRAISESNLNYPGGTIKEGPYEFLIRTIGQFQTVDEIAKIAVTRDKEAPQKKAGPSDDTKNQLILLGDVARVSRVPKERTSFSRYDARENITLSIQKQAQVNTIQVANDVLKQLTQLKSRIPEDVTIVVIENQAEFIQQTINEVWNAAIQGAFLAFLFLLIFLRNLRYSLLVIISVPITILAIFIIMYFSGMTLNVISLCGFALAAGMIVDSSIVVVENVFRHSGEDPKKSQTTHIIYGTKEVMTAVLAGSLTTMMVFLPIIFVEGLAGQFFKELAIIIVLTQIFASLIAFTIVPVLISSVKTQALLKSNPIFDHFSKVIASVEQFYARMLPIVLNHKGTFLLMAMALFGLSLFAAFFYERTLIPRANQGQFAVRLALPSGTPVEQTDELVKQIEVFLKPFHEIEHVSAIVGASIGDSTEDEIEYMGPHEANITIDLKKKYVGSTEKLIQRIKQGFEQPAMKKELKDAEISFVLNTSGFSAGFLEGTPVEVQIKGRNIGTLEALTQKVQSQIEKIPGIYDVTNTIPDSAPETQIIVNKDRAAFYRLAVSDLAAVVQTSLKGTVASTFKEEDHEIGIRVVLRKEDRSKISELPFIQLKSPLGLNVPFNELVQFKNDKGPSEIVRSDRERTLQVAAKVYRRSLNDVIKDVRTAIQKIKTPPGYTVFLTGEDVEIKNSYRSLIVALILSILLIYMVMAAQFESYFRPFIIMFTVPLSVIGASLALGMTRTPISIVVFLGMILLGGVVVNNGIILVDFVNERIKAGSDFKTALTESASVRFRPIMITAGSTIAGLIPAALGFGEGLKFFAPLAITVLGGLLIATFLTLLMIPAIYAYSMELKDKLFPKKSIAPCSELLDSRD